MELPIQLFRVFIATPNDLNEERRALRTIVDRINAIYSKETEWRIELLGWEDTLPGAGRPQALINSDLEKADLFIGCLWQRWGSSSGNDGKTGFEEEFDLALARREKTGNPEMWLFFKELDVVRKNDPGEQLRKVLAFREREIGAKRLLFRDFPDLATWNDLISELLHRHVVKLVTSRSKTAKSLQGTEAVSSVPQNPETDSSLSVDENQDSTLSSLTNVLKTTATKVKLGKITHFNNSDPIPLLHSIRLNLFANANYDWNIQKISFGVHEINLVFWHRRELTISLLERLFILKSLTVDSTLTKPGWYWFREAGIKPAKWLRWLSVSQNDNATNIAAINFATEAKIRIFSEREKIEDFKKLLSHNVDPGLRVALMRHIVATGIERDIKYIEPYTKDSNKEIRDRAERSIRMLRLKYSPDSELRESIARGDLFDEEILSIASSVSSQISTKTLIAATSNQSGALKAFASALLLARKEVTPELAVRFCSDEAKAVKECGYIAQVDAGNVIETSTVRAALAQLAFAVTTPPAWNVGTAEKVILMIFERLSSLALWEIVEKFDQDSPLALQSIGKRRVEADISRIRAELDDDFERLKSIKELSSPKVAWDINELLSPGSNAAAIQRELRLVALRIIAECGSSADRQLFLKYLSKGAESLDQTIICLQGLACHGVSEDRAHFVSLIKNNLMFIGAAAARAFLALSPDILDATRVVLADRSVYTLWVCIFNASKKRPGLLWPAIEPLLRDPDDRIRHLACGYALKSFKKHKLKGILDDYISKTPYYYNVVTLLDRSLHAPKKFAEFFSDRESVFFESFKPGATWQWEWQA